MNMKMKMTRHLRLICAAALLVLVSAGALAACGGEATITTAAVSPETTDAVSTTTVAGPTTTVAGPTTTLSAGDTGVDYPNILYNTFKGLGKGQLDVDAWKATAAAQMSVDWGRDSFLYRDEMDPAVLAHWEARGIKKEMHDADDPLLKWASYTPLTAFEEGNTAVYPVVFDFVGAERLIFAAEGHGLAYLAAEEGFIAVLPSNPVAMEFAGETVDLTPGEQVQRILDALEKGGYPIDKSRVYVCGMSAGGVATSRAGLALPDVVAAVAMHSSLPVVSTTEGAWSFPGAWTPVADYAKAMDYGLPMLAICGDHDFDMLPITNEGVIDGLNHWLEINGCPTRATPADSAAAQEDSADPAVEAIGIVGDNMWTDTINDVLHYGAEFRNADGVTMVEIVCVTNLPHFPSASFPRLAWDFMSRFSRDSDGNLIIAQ
jgi:acetyl esterase/lipase